MDENVILICFVRLFVDSPGMKLKSVICTLPLINFKLQRSVLPRAENETIGMISDRFNTSKISNTTLCSTKVGLVLT